MTAAQPPNLKLGVKWLYRASLAGHVRAQYQLGLCFHQGRGADSSMQQAVWNSFSLSLWVFMNEVTFVGTQCKA